MIICVFKGDYYYETSQNANLNKKEGSDGKKKWNKFLLFYSINNDLIVVK